MDNIVYIIFRRMRAPLLALVITYSLAMLGLVLVPGQDPQGNVWHLDFFHAFYFVSFMATTVGFGEIPYEFTDAQRLWATFSIYATVVAWVYSIGAVIALLQNQTFLRALREDVYATRVKRLREPFYLVCGYGDTGRELVESLTERDKHVVVVEIDQDRVSSLKLENLRQYVPAISGDAGRPQILLDAGLRHSQCTSVVAVTNKNEINLKIAITSKLLREDITVICRADSLEVEANMASFGTDYIVDPFDTFANLLAIALQAPCMYLLHEWLSGMSDELLQEPIYPPSDGFWILCGYGRFGKAVYKHLQQQGIRTVIIEAYPDATGSPPEGCVIGWGTEAVTLQEANIEKAVGLVAGTHDDTNNLSIVMSARELNPDLFIIARHNLRENQALFDAAEANLVMYPARIIADKIRVLLGTPLHNEFEQLARSKDDEWACELISRVVAVTNKEVPEVWEVTLNRQDTHAVCAAVSAGSDVFIDHIIADPRERSHRLPCVALLLKRANSTILVPEADTRLRENDHLLFCGQPQAADRMDWTLQNEHALSYVLTGEAPPQGWVWKVFKRRTKES
ncbi:MAG: potassium transporter TrkA [Gammaproteobacteria bacterium]|nr:potassium transporter TrkA [Gammaproteobacteria bacterium]